jgi:hypothetical protein
LSFVMIWRTTFLDDSRRARRALLGEPLQDRRCVGSHIAQRGSLLLADELELARILGAASSSTRA